MFSTAVVYGIDHQWQADLVDLAKLSYNKGFKYLMTCIDVLSRYVWVVPLMGKTGKTLKDAFHVISRDFSRWYAYGSVNGVVIRCDHLE
jgi:hypothetical protein